MCVCVFARKLLGISYSSIIILTVFFRLSSLSPSRSSPHRSLPAHAGWHKATVQRRRELAGNSPGRAAFGLFGGRSELLGARSLHGSPEGAHLGSAAGGSSRPSSKKSFLNGLVAREALHARRREDKI